MYVYINELGREFYVPIPTLEYEFCSILAHMIVKEGIMTLNDALTLLTYYSLVNLDKLFSVIQSQGLDLAFNIFLKALKAMTFPVKLSMKDMLLVLFERAPRPSTRTSIPTSLYSIAHRLRRVVDHSRRITYIRGLAR